MNSDLIKQLTSRVAGIRSIQLTRPMKATVFGMSLGLVLIGFLTMFFQRKQTKKRRPERKAPAPHKLPKTSRVPIAVSPNGDITWSRRSTSPSLHLFGHSKSLSGSVSSVCTSSTTSTLTHSAVDTTSLTPSQMCQLGLECIEMAISHWEDGIAKLSYFDEQDTLAIPDADTSNLQHQLEHLLHLAYRMQDDFERQCERQADQIALDSALAAFAEVDLLRAEKTHGTDPESSEDQESFVSATDMADLTDLDTYRELFKRLPLYEAALQEQKYNGIHCRTVRTEMVGCLKDAEFLAKLHCLREAFELVFKDSDTRKWFADLGRNVMGGLLLKAERDPDQFYEAYQDMVVFLNNPDNWSQMEEELKERGVKRLSFYDVLLDFILLDAFDDLETPPNSVMSVVQNRWLSNGFKETALSTAVWSVLKAKRKMLKCPNGFIAHFYSISEHISPILVWGLLGPQSSVKDVCLCFKETVLDFIKDIFSFEKVRFTTQDEMAGDVLKAAKERGETIQRFFSCLESDPVV